MIDASLERKCPIIGAWRSYVPSENWSTLIKPINTKGKRSAVGSWRSNRSEISGLKMGWGRGLPSVLTLLIFKMEMPSFGSWVGGGRRRGRGLGEND